MFPGKLPDDSVTKLKLGSDFNIVAGTSPNLDTGDHGIPNAQRYILSNLILNLIMIWFLN